MSPVEHPPPPLPLEPLTRAPVIPVVEIDDAADAVPLARALLAGGLPVIEVTLRTPAAHDAIRAIADAVPEVLVGAGTVRRPEDIAPARAAGAAFLVSPGTTPRLAQALAAARDEGVPALPGAATVSEILTLADLGFTAVKLFPAAAAGGVAFVRALAGPVPQVWICPTGGVTAASAADYLQLPSVPCVGGTWVAPREAIRRRDWATITATASAADALRPR